MQERLRPSSGYGLPERLLMDNGSPWGSDAAHPRTPLTLWVGSDDASCWPSG